MGQGSEAGLFDRLHAAGITGEGVRVGVVDPTGFDPGRESIRNRVVTLEWFGSDPRIVDDVSHGTAAATTVTTAAPDAELYLAGFDDIDGFERAVAWARGQDLDVLLTPIAAHGAAAGSTSRVGRAAAGAVDDGLLVVAPTGNAARGHWSRPVSLEELTTGFQSGRIAVRSLADGSPDERFIAWVADDGPAALELGLALVERTDQGDGRNLIALSQSVGDGRGHRLTATLDGGDYWLEVHHRSGDVTGAQGGFRVEVTTPTHRLVPAKPAGSIAAPATEPDVLAVGATGEAGATVAPYSGRGPTADGRVGVDLVAPPRPWTGMGTPGTSAAAARTAGIAALVRERYAAPPRTMMELLRATATDLGADGVGLATGAGRLDAELAIQRARARASES